MFNICVFNGKLMVQRKNSKNKQENKKHTIKKKQ